MQHFQILSRWDSSKVLYEGEADSLKDLVALAVDKGADLRGADLRGADLTDAYLTGADLRGADLRGADLTDAYLTGADLRGADLTGADLRGADLTDADLRGADLTDAYLRGADLQPIKADFFLVLLDAIPEIAGLRQSLVDGRVETLINEKVAAVIAKHEVLIRRSRIILRPEGSAEQISIAISPNGTYHIEATSALAIELEASNSFRVNIR